MEITVNGVRLFYEQTGSGRPLIMVHGNSEDHTTFRDSIPLFLHSRSMTFARGQMDVS